MVVDMNRIYDLVFTTECLDYDIKQIETTLSGRQNQHHTRSIWNDDTQLYYDILHDTCNRLITLRDRLNVEIKEGYKQIREEKEKEKKVEDGQTG